MKSESGFSFAIASQPFQFLSFEGKFIICQFSVAITGRDGTTTTFIPAYVQSDPWTQLEKYFLLDINLRPGTIYQYSF